MKILPGNRRIGILLSGRGSNFKAIADHIDSKELDAEIGVVVSNNESAPGLEDARRRGFNSVYLNPKDVSREDFDSRAVEILRESGVGIVCLAGFMQILTPVLINAFPLRILNIHPSLLPAFPGLNAQEQALEHGVKLSGCTVHFVNESLDGGPIICQASVPVYGEDSPEALSDRILVEEHRLYSIAIGLVLSGCCEIEGRRIRIHD